MYGKIFESIYDGTLSADDAYTFIAAHSTANNGVVEKAANALASMCGLPVERVRKSLDRLETCGFLERCQHQQKFAEIGGAAYYSAPYACYKIPERLALSCLSQIPESSRRPKRLSTHVARGVVFERDNWTCLYCGAHGVALHVDHYIPSSRGGSNDLWNLKTACAECNKSKSDKMPEEWLQ